MMPYAKLPLLRGRNRSSDDDFRPVSSTVAISGAFAGLISAAFQVRRCGTSRLGIISATAGRRRSKNGRRRTMHYC